MILKDKIWWTKEARIYAEKRLRFNDMHSQIILIWYSFSSVAISIYYLGDTKQPIFISKIWIIFSVLVLTASIMINSFSFKERARNLKENYQKLDDLYNNYYFLKKSQRLKAYTDLIVACENHERIDHIKAKVIRYKYGGTVETPPLQYFTKYRNYNLMYFAFLAFIYLLPISIFSIIKIS